MIKKHNSAETIKMAEETLKKCKDARVYKLAMAVLLTARDGYEPEEAAKILNVSKTTLSRYRKNFTEAVYQLPKKLKTNNNSHLTWEEEVEVLKTIEAAAKRGELTTIYCIKAEYEKVARCKVSKNTIYRFLDRHGWRKITPRPRHPKADTEKQEEFKKNFPKPCNK